MLSMSCEVHLLSFLHSWCSSACYFSLEAWPSQHQRPLPVCCLGSPCSHVNLHLFQLSITQYLSFAFYFSTLFCLLHSSIILFSTFEYFIPAAMPKPLNLYQQLLIPPFFNANFALSSCRFLLAWIASSPGACSITRVTGSELPVSIQGNGRLNASCSGIWTRVH